MFLPLLADTASNNDRGDVKVRRRRSPARSCRLIAPWRRKARRQLLVLVGERYERLAEPIASFHVSHPAKSCGLFLISPYTHRQALHDCKAEIVGSGNVTGHASALSQLPYCKAKQCVGRMGSEFQKETLPVPAQAPSKVVPTFILHHEAPNTIVKLRLG